MPTASWIHDIVGFTSLNVLYGARSFKLCNKRKRKNSRGNEMIVVLMLSVFGCSFNFLSS
jgi:hypothetical protein